MSESEGEIEADFPAGVTEDNTGTLIRTDLLCDTFTHTHMVICDSSSNLEIKSTPS